MRIFLALPLAFALITILPEPARAQFAAQPAEIQDIYACRSLSEPTSRLECYDKAVGRFETAQKSGEVVTISKSDVEKVEREAFGFDIPSLPKLGRILGFGGKKSQSVSNEADDATLSNESSQVIKYSRSNEIEEVAYEIERITKFDAIKKRFYFKNGQVWEQTTGSNLNIPKSPWTAEITKGSLGGYKLKLNGKGWKVKVRRVK